MFAWPSTTIPAGDVLSNDVIHGWSFSSALSPALSTNCSTDEDLLRRLKLLCLWSCSMEQFASCTAVWWCDITNISRTFKSSSL